jgi:hypothetical protein
MSAPTRRVNVEVDGPGIATTFGFGLAVGFLVAYPALPAWIRSWNPGVAGITLGPIGGPLLVGVGLFLCFFLGILLLNWLFLETE